MLKVFLGKQSERADQQAQVLDSILEGNFSSIFDLEKL